MTTHAGKALKCVLSLLLGLALIAGCARPAATPPASPTAGLPRPTADTQATGLVGRLGSNTVRAVAVSGSYAYASLGTEIVVLDIADPAKPLQVGRLLLPEGVSDVAVAGHGLYLGGPGGLRIADVSDPRRPALVESAAAEPYVDRIAVAGGYAYLSGAGLRILSLADPLAPVEVGRFSLSGPEGPVGSLAAVADGYAYTVYTRAQSGRNPAGGLRILDVRDPAQPAAVANLLLDEPIIDLAVAGGYAYLLASVQGGPGAGLAGGRLRVLDLSDPRNPHEIALAHDAEWRGQRLSAGGRWLYLVQPAPDGQPPALTVLDMADPSRPAAVGRYEGLQPPIAAVTAAGERLFVGSGGGLAIVDVREPKAPAALGLYRRAQGIERSPAGGGVALAGSYAYLAAGVDGLLVVDLADPAEPIVTGAVDTPGHAWSVAVAGDYAYVADEYAGLRIVDIRDPEHPREAGAYDPPGLTDFAHGVAVAGRYACVADGDLTRSGLRVIDVADPAHPREVAFLPLSGEGAGPGAPRAEAVVMAGDLVYLAGGTAGLRVIDIADPAAPREVGVFDTPGRADNLAVAGRYAYLIDGDLRILDLADPRRPVEVGFVDLPNDGGQAFVAVQGSRAYVTGAGLHVFDVSDPARPMEVARYNLPGGAVAAAGATVCVLGPDLYVLRDP